MDLKINFNGSIQDEAFISVLDHGFLFGDSVYEVVATHGNKLCFLEAHLARLRNSAAGISLEIPSEDEWFVEQISRTVQSANFEETYIRIIVTRGVGEIDIDPGSCDRPNIIIIAAPAKVYPHNYYEKGIDLALVSVKRNARESLNPGIKTGNYLNNILAKMEANRLGAQDALMLNAEGVLTEGTTSNFFFVNEGKLFTPSLDCGILSGITRDVAIQLALENGIPLEEGHWPPEELTHAEEAFVTGTVKKIMPATRLDGKPIGNGKPGPITARFMRLYDQLLDEKYGMQPAQGRSQ